jgi:putative ABC transport system ATP-binding protein
MTADPKGKALDSSDSFVLVQDVSREYRQGGQKQLVLDNACFSLRKGETTALLGRSGCGKTTLLNLLSGIDHLTSGSIIINGVSLGSLDEKARTRFRRRHIGFIYQFFNLVPGLTALENVALMAELNGSAVGESMNRAAHFLSLLGLSDKADSFPEQLSGGEQQRVAIARALVHAPDLVLADEPTGNLDARSGEEVMQLFSSHLKQQGTTTLIVTHSLAVAKTADRILTLDNGTIEERWGEFAW